MFGETSQAVAASSAYILGVLIALSGLLNASMRRAGGLEIIPVPLAVILFVIPFAFGFTAVGALAWSAWIIAILVALAVGSLFVVQGRRATA